MFFQNHIEIEGRMVRDAEIKVSKNGKEYCNFTFCYNESRKDKETNEWNNIAHYFNCVAFSKNIQSVKELKRGTPIHIAGKLQFSQYFNKNGEKSTSISILVNDIKQVILTKGKKSENEEMSDYDKDIEAQMNYRNTDTLDCDAIPF